jgi:5-methylcytosine-specific restriction endonuclease McrA
VTELYWPHARVFPSPERILFQNRPQRGERGHAEIVTLIERFRAADGTQASLHRARIARPDAFAKLVHDVEWKLVEMPLPRLQIIGGSRAEFLYAIEWEVGIRRSEFRSKNFINTIRFVGGAAECLVRLAGLLRPLIQREWAAQIARFNGLPDAQLEDFLFSSDRIALGALCAPLIALQAGTCFYCQGRLPDEGVNVDHFIPWSRHPNDAIENLVATHATCNASKSDHLAASTHLRRWVERNDREARALAQIAADATWTSEQTASLGVAQGIYLRLPDDTSLWRSRSDFESSQHATFAALFA